MAFLICDDTKDVSGRLITLSKYNCPFCGGSGLVEYGDEESSYCACTKVYAVNDDYVTGEDVIGIFDWKNNNKIRMFTKLVICSDLPSQTPGWVTVAKENCLHCHGSGVTYDGEHYNDYCGCPIRVRQNDPRIIGRFDWATNRIVKR